MWAALSRVSPPGHVKQAAKQWAVCCRRATAHDPPLIACFLMGRGSWVVVWELKAAAVDPSCKPWAASGSSSLGWSNPPSCSPQFVGRVLWVIHQQLGRRKKPQNTNSLLRTTACCEAGKPQTRNKNNHYIIENNPQRNLKKLKWIKN